uniref:Ubiquitin domain-containing protein DSK2,putative n=1 Tax=Plasmodium falciparum (isolate 3D7) TaxID=36329 RepID=UPI0013AE8752|nr:Chain A, Ubiquitin domain-containing protein DSK2,putative [Plasmodium falciparum 3D7]
MAMVINVSFKVTGGKEFTVAIEPDITVLDLKKICAEHVDIPVEAQRIIFKGKILKDKESLTLYGVADGNTMHLVRSAMA